MQLPNVSLHTDAVTKFEKDAICTDSETFPIDAVVFATGFDAVGFLQPMQIHGLNGVSLHEQWATQPKALMGIAAPEFPNMFVLYGPNTNLGHNSIIYMVEHQVNYIIKLMKHMIEKGHCQIEARASATEEYNEQVQKYLGESVWAGDCSSWYKKGDGTIPNNWWGSASAYGRQMRKPDFSLFRFTGKGVRP